MIDIFLYFLFILSIIFGIYAQIKVNSTFNRFSSVKTYGKSASEVARYILDTNGLGNVKIEHVKGSLTDHFDPRTNTLRLSDTVFDSTSAAAIGVAAHEVGHALQHKEGYLPIRIRSAIVPVTNFASRLFWPIIFLGVLLMSVNPEGIGYYVMLVGIGLYSFVTLFHLVTLPGEYNASHRAMVQLEGMGVYGETELWGAKSVLSAAALTYVASLLASAITLLRLLMSLRRRR